MDLVQRACARKQRYITRLVHKKKNLQTSNALNSPVTAYSRDQEAVDQEGAYLTFTQIVVRYDPIIYVFFSH